jgi:hypothetical protein
MDDTQSNTEIRATDDPVVGALVSALSEVAAQHAGEHPEQHQLLDYLQGRMSEEAQEKLQDHLVSCRECTGQLLELELISCPQPPADQGVADFELAAAWRGLADNISSAQQSGYRSRRLHFVSGLAAALLVATIGLGFWVAQLDHSLDRLQQAAAALNEPQLNPSILYLGGSTRSDASAGTIVLEPGSSSLMLILTPTELHPVDEYEIVLSRADGRQLFQGRGLRRSDHGTIRLSLPTGMLPAGEYRISLFGLVADQRLELGEQAFHVSYGD